MTWEKAVAVDRVTIKVRPVSHCCYFRCTRRAEWTIAHCSAPDDYTEACTEHIGALLTDAPEHRIYPLKAD